MIRNIIKINEEKCNGCGLCAKACHEGAIGMVNNKAKLLRDDYCDGLGNCLPACPTGAITFEEREADAYNEEASLINKDLLNHNLLNHDLENQDKKRNEKEKLLQNNEKLPCGCPGTQSKKFERESKPESVMIESQSKLMQWPVQIKLVPVNAPYFEGANLLVSADCSAYAYGDFHNRFIKNHITLIGCPKLDEGDYADKLTAIIKNNNIKSVTVVRMEVPCCGGIENAVKTALKDSGKFIPWQVVTISTDGQILDE